ncbi:hypothetical protein H5R92_01415 [Limosilactobacillus sp. BG-MG3-A]|uniref:Papain-like cysteine peptidase n=1 Tax=Limosilactobacillus agrestis TaxID=2759748 RepID=A0A7W3YKG4_9LACO|nr:DUF1796 family putative cysteine peptidase [Limosilactobacillus agrestis]MBB1094878.1 hypothetical protein [Limosilactobacillus agrestis]
MDYKNYISLGYFCNVASDLEQLGLRNTSSPFDWVISDFEGVIQAIDNQFSDFMVYDNLIQSEKFRNHYFDSKYKIYFFHDFDEYTSLRNQYNIVKEKYDRRIKRFLSNIKEPTIFFRYISSEKDMANELKYIEKNYDYIVNTIKRYNQNNKLIFIGDESVNSGNKFTVYHVKVDNNDIVSRHPIINNDELHNIVKNFTVYNQEENIKRFNEKQNKKKKTRITSFVLTKYKALFRQKYRHEKSFYWETK